jgi:hypothetical protein
MPFFFGLFGPKRPRKCGSNLHFGHSSPMRLFNSNTGLPNFTFDNKKKQQFRIQHGSTIVTFLDGLSTFSGQFSHMMPNHL